MDSNRLKRMMPCLLVYLAPLLLLPAHAQNSTCTAARRLVQEGKEAEAFRLYLKTDGAEHLAMRLARPRPDEFLRLLNEGAAEVPAPRLKLIEGDIRLALGQKESSLQCYRAVAAGMVRDKVFVPAVFYPVEPPALSGEDGLGGGIERPARCFTVGPGSHRDNWIIRRCIALEAWDAAATEFGRIWDVHRENTRPYVLTWVVPATTNQPASTNRCAVTQAGFDGMGLQFAIDYAYFLKRRGDTNAALAVLMEPIREMNMDRNPAMERREMLPDGAPSPYPERQSPPPTQRSFGGWMWHGFSAGISRKEFLRLAYGEFKSAGKADQLQRAIQDRIAGGDNRARRLLARLYLHDGRAGDALALELAYIEQGKFGALTAAYRRGMVYEDASNPEEAAQEYEKALALPYSAPTTPDQDEEAAQNAMMSQAMVSYGSTFGGDEYARTSFQQDVVARLQRLYASLGRKDRAMELSLKQFELNDTLCDRFELLRQTVTRLRAAGQEKMAVEWLRNRAATATRPSAKANLCWLAGDVDEAIRAIAAQVKGTRPSYPYYHDMWKDLCRNAGSETYVRLLSALVEADPKDAQSRLELLDARGIVDGPDVAAVLELLLNGDTAPAFARGKGVRNRTRFRNYFDLAYRLMRIYERTPDSDAKLRALGFRVLEGAGPFGRKEKLLADYRANWNDSFFDDGSTCADILSCLYVFLAHLQAPEDIERAAARIEKTGSVPLLNQVNRIRTDRKRPWIEPVTGHETVHESVVVRTLGIPDGVRVLANRDDVRAIAPGARWGGTNGEPARAWIGTSWGLVRYMETDRAGGRLEILQIPTGAGVTTFADGPSGPYVGTRDGLYRLNGPYTETPQLIRIGIEVSDEKKRDRVERTVTKKGETLVCTIHDPFPVRQLMWWSNSLWVCADNGLYRYDPTRTEVQFFGTPAGNLFAACGRLWTERAVYDAASQVFRTVESGFREWRLIGGTERDVWADVVVNDQIRHRPALLDLETLKLRVLPIADPARMGELQNSDLCFMGEREGQVWLSGHNPPIILAYNRARDELKVRDAPPPPISLWAPGQAERAVAAVKLNLRGDRGPRLCDVPLPDGRLLVGNAIVRQWMEDNFGYDEDRGMSFHIQDLEGGLFDVNPAAGTWRKIGSGQEQLGDFYVNKAVRIGDRLYVCTSGGVTILSLPDGRVVGRITVSDGLPSNKVADVARVGDRLYLACELGDENGGLAVQDLKTGLIQILTMADGLKCNKVRKLRAEGNRLHVIYGTIYGPRAYATPLQDSVVAPGPGETAPRWSRTAADDRVRTFRSSVLDTETGRFSDGTEVIPSAVPPEAMNSPLPLLGGTVLFRDQDVAVAPADTPKFIAGTHGLVMLTSRPGDTALVSSWPREEVRVVKSIQMQQLEEAGRRPMNVAESTDLQKALADPNPFYRARAAASLLGRGELAKAHVSHLARLLDDRESRVRSTALYTLTRLTPDEQILAAITHCLKDADPHIRAFAAIEVARRGVLPEIGHLRAILKTGNYGNFPFGANSSIGVVAGVHELHEAVAPIATPEVFALLMEFPPYFHNYDNETRVFPQLGAALLKHPEAAKILLAAHDPRQDGSPRRDFAQHVFRFAGKKMLPALHAALGSKDRVARSNAARACGAIGDPSSVPPLVKALEMESGLARASIVWALGELKATEAIPRLVSLFADAKNDEKRRRGTGFLAAQSQAEIRSQYDTIGNIDTLAGDWNELKEAALNPPLNPRGDEDLLSPAGILEAVSRIGPASAQDFYRALAGDKDDDARREAAIRLADCRPDDLGKNAAILKNLLGDADANVRISAAVSLLVMKQDASQRPVLEWLERGDNWEKIMVLRALRRLTDRSLLKFAQPVIARLAADATVDGETRRLASSLAE